MVRTFGDFIEMSEEQEYLIINFSPNSLPIQQRWRNNGLSADFIADYWVTFFPAYDIPTRNIQTEVRDSVGYIANELLENAMKFNYETSRQTTSIGVYLSRDALRFYVSNSVNPETLRHFQDFIQDVLTEDPDELYIRQLESNAREDDDTISRLGFLTMINDYNVRLAWKFETIQRHPNIVRVTTMVKLSIDSYLAHRTEQTATRT